MAGVNGVQEQVRTLNNSVKKDDEAGTIYFFAPYLNFGGGALPPELPDYGANYGYHNLRDIVLLSTPKYSDQWANALEIAISKMASQGIELDSELPRVKGRLMQILLNAGAGQGVFGWVPFLSAHLNSYLNLGIAYVEIERMSRAKESPVKAIHHLNPLKCRLTGDPITPVRYQADKGESRPLKWWQVMIITDMPDPTEGNMYQFRGAGARSYQTIRKDHGLEQFIREKVTGRRPLAIDFVSGVTKRALDSSLLSAQHEADSAALRSYMGAAIVPVPGDIAVSSVRIPLAELPDITDVERERNRNDLVYANSIGLDPQDLNPALVGRQGLGSTGNQSQVLAEKGKGRGLAKWRQDFSQQINQLAMPNSVTYSFVENDLQDRAQQADNKNKRAQWAGLLIDKGMATPDQGKNLLADEGDLPPEFIDPDTTGADKLRDDQKPDTAAEQQERDQRPEPKPEPAPQQEEKKEYNPWEEVYY